MFRSPELNQGILDRELLEAVDKGDTAAVKKLIEERANVNTSICVRRPIEEAAANGHADVIDLLIAARAEVDVRNCYKETPLHYAAERGHTGAVNALLAGKADVNAINNSYGETPLHRAAQYNKIDTVKALVAGEADINAPNKMGDTPIKILGAREDAARRPQETTALGILLSSLDAKEAAAKEAAGADSPGRKMVRFNLNPDDKGPAAGGRGGRGR